MLEEVVESLDTLFFVYCRRCWNLIGFFEPLGTNFFWMILQKWVESPVMLFTAMV